MPPSCACESITYSGRASRDNACALASTEGAMHNATNLTRYGSHNNTNARSQVPVSLAEQAQAPIVLAHQSSFAPDKGGGHQAVAMTPVIQPPAPGSGRPYLPRGPAAASSAKSGL